MNVLIAGLAGITTLQGIPCAACCYLAYVQPGLSASAVPHLLSSVSVAAAVMLLQESLVMGSVKPSRTLCNAHGPLVEPVH